MQDTLRNAIRTLSQKYEIEPKKIRIKISKPNKDLVYHIMENGEEIAETNLASALNLSTLKAFAAGIKLNSIFDKLSQNNQINKSTMNARIYTTSDDFSPEIYLFDSTVAKKRLTLEDFD